MPRFYNLEFLINGFIQCILFISDLFKKLFWNSSMLLHMSIFHFLLLGSISFYDYTTIYVSTLWYKFVLFLVWGSTNKAATNISTFVWTWAFPSVNWIPVYGITRWCGGERVNFSRNLPVFPTVTVPFYIPNSSTQMLQLLHFVGSTWYFFKILTILTVKPGFVVVLTVVW